MQEEQALVAAIDANPGDTGPLLIYADWLEERGDPRGEFLHAWCRIPWARKQGESIAPYLTRILQLRSQIEPDWIARFGLFSATVENCDQPVMFRFRCPQQWEELEPTADRSVRYCQACQKEVKYCGTIGEARQYAKYGGCVAIAESVPRPIDLSEPREMLLGALFQT